MMIETTSRLITKSFKRLLDKGIHRGFITYEELSKSLGKRHFSIENVEKASLHIFDNKVCLVEKKSDYKSNKKRETSLFKIATSPIGIPGENIPSLPDVKTLSPSLT